MVGTAPTLLLAGAGGGLVGAGFSFCFPVLTGTLQTEVPDAFAVANQHNVLGMIIAQDGHRTEPVFGDGAQHFGPGSAIALGIIELSHSRREQSMFGGVESG